MALVDPKTLGLNLWLIIGALLLSVFVIILIIAAWTGVNIGIWQYRRKAAERDKHRRTHRPDGRPYPPAMRGLCQRCQRVHESVYHLPSGERLCPGCYEESLSSPLKKGTGSEQSEASEAS